MLGLSALLSLFLAYSEHFQPCYRYFWHCCLPFCHQCNLDYSYMTIMIIVGVVFIIHTSVLLALLSPLYDYCTNFSNIRVFSAYITIRSMSICIASVLIIICHFSSLPVSVIVDILSLVVCICCKSICV